MVKPNSFWESSHGKNPLNFSKPRSKITLVQNLEQEIMDLCSQGTLNKMSNHHRVVSPFGFEAKVSVRSVSSKPNLISPSSLLTTTRDTSGGVNLRSLSGIYRAKVIDAYRNRRIFTVYGNYHTIRRALLRRGWLEKLAPGRYQKLSVLSEEMLLQHAKKGNEFEAMAISKIINHFPPFFIWQPKKFRDLAADVLPFRNRIRRTNYMDFSHKVGLIGCAEQEHWFRFSGFCGMNYPRFYRLRNAEERTEFIEEFRRTQCRNLVRFIIENRTHPDEIVDVENGTIQPSKVLIYAISGIKQQLSDWEHHSLDENGGQNEYDEIEWKSFLANSICLISGNGKLRMRPKELEEFVNISKGYIDKILEKRPDYRWDGVQNLWILKPGYKSRGIGIIIRRSLEDILQYAQTNSNKTYIVQKYIERPLLIHNCKFDIRQYMLVTIGATVASIWLYNDCYLRFSSQQFSVSDLRESIHLTNYSVQKRYKIKNTRDPRLPKNNMWSLEQFKIFLKHKNEPEDTWSKIHAGLRENLIAVVLASFDETNFIENAFELYGCDFMLDEKHNPILIEINSTPDLSCSTDVTARICPTVLKDLVKVVVDLPRNSRASTGLFERVYEVNYKSKQDFEPKQGLEIIGKAMVLHGPRKDMFPKTSVVKRNNGEIKVKTQLNKPKKSIKLPTNPQQMKKKSCDKMAPARSSSKGNKSKLKPLKSITKETLALQYTRPM